MWLISDGTTGIITAAIVVERYADIPQAVQTLIARTRCDPAQVVVNPVGQPVDVS